MRCDDCLQKIPQKEMGIVVEDGQRQHLFWTCPNCKKSDNIIFGQIANIKAFPKEPLAGYLPSEDTIEKLVKIKVVQDGMNQIHPEKKDYLGVPGARPLTGGDIIKAFQQDSNQKAFQRHDEQSDFTNYMLLQHAAPSDASKEYARGWTEATKEALHWMQKRK